MSSLLPTRPTRGSIWLSNPFSRTSHATTVEWTFKPITGRFTWGYALLMWSLRRVVHLQEPAKETREEESHCKARQGKAGGGTSNSQEGQVLLVQQMWNDPFQHGIPECAQETAHGQHTLRLHRPLK